jgi:phospholipase/carboxylesterase
MITAAAVARTESWLPGHSTLTRKVYAGLGHGISSQEAGDVATFVKVSLGVTSSVPRSGRQEP